MNENGILEPIPFDVAVSLCEQIRQEADREWYTALASWCWECRQSAGGDPAKRGFLRQPGNRGCILVNDRYAQLKGALQ